MEKYNNRFKICNKMLITKIKTFYQTNKTSMMKKFKIK